MVFAPGEMALLLDQEGKRHLIRLVEGDQLHSHLGAVKHTDVIGQPDGTFVRSSQGRVFAAVRPRLADYVLDMQRRSGIVYPKDAGHILTWADIGPGMRVLESGVGSGGLTLALLRAVGERGQVIGYEQRADFLELAHDNVRAFGDATTGNLLLRERDVYEGIVDADVHRVVLDLPEPWRVVPHLPGALVPAAGSPRTRRRLCRPRNSSKRCARRASTCRSRLTRCCCAVGTSRARRFDPSSRWSATRVS